MIKTSKRIWFLFQVVVVATLANFSTKYLLTNLEQQNHTQTILEFFPLQIIVDKTLPNTYYVVIIHCNNPEYSLYEQRHLQVIKN